MSESNNNESAVEYLPPIIVKTEMVWFDPEIALPPLFDGVLVFGVCPGKKDDAAGFYEARRWTGWTSGVDVEKERAWDWLASPGDYLVTKVYRWIHRPKLEWGEHAKAMREAKE